MMWSFLPTEVEARGVGYFLLFCFPVGIRNQLRCTESEDQSEHSRT